MYIFPNLATHALLQKQTVICRSSLRETDEAKFARDISPIRGKKNEFQ